MIFSTVFHIQKKLSKWIPYMYAVVKKPKSMNTKDVKLTFFSHKFKNLKCQFEMPSPGILVNVVSYCQQKEKICSQVWNKAQKGIRNVTLINLFSHFSGGK